MTLDLGLAARVITGIRTETAKRTGCPEWDAAGVSSALIATVGAPGAVLAAAALAAEDPKLLKPSAVGFLNHWPKNAVDGPRVSHNVACVDHPAHDMPCPHRDHAGDMTLEQIAEAKAACLAEAEAARVHRAARPTIPTMHDLEQVRAQADQETR